MFLQDKSLNEVSRQEEEISWYVWQPTL